MNKHKLVPAGPTDDELIAWAGEEQFFLFCDRDEFLQIARAVMQRYAAPQPTEQQPDVTQLVEALGCILSMDDEIQIVDVMDSKAREMVEIARAALAAYRKGGEV